MSTCSCARWTSGSFVSDSSGDDDGSVAGITTHPVAFLSMLYLCSFLDRINIGNARAAGIQEDLELSDEQFNWGSAIFFFGYVIFEVPSNVLLDLWRPSKIIALSMIAWGIIMISMAGIYNYPGLLSTRFFLGATEAGLFPGVVFYLSMWYTRAEQASISRAAAAAATVRMALFFGAATLAGAFGGLIAYAILKLEGENGLSGWQWIFVIEGTATVFIAFFALYFLPDFPEDENATFLTERERALAIARLAQDVTDAHSGRASGHAGDDHFFQINQIIGAFKDWKVYMYALVHILGSMPLYSFALNLPSILQGHGYDGVTSQLLSAPPYMFGCIVLLAVSHSSGVRGERGFHVAGAMLLGAIGFLILVFARNTSIQYTAAILACMGVFAQLPPVLSWFSNNLGGHLKRAAGTAVIISLGNLSGALGAHLYQDEDAPNYALGHTISAFSLLAGAVVSLSLKWLLHRENSRRRRLLPNERYHLVNSVESALLGDNHPDFRYIH
ncbi:putative MFS transporter [Syncephalis pseudoplumigaleata]|uniref:Putative MFS transporter n=1 Tax=Syncephalis pseudoplumigaleata TaxID=1712513 RepID=A0A4P9YV48_9FUNG|nr:putative MFS transporter [Syncephalis pseudoplumigaleata]|eukprot:RKP22780.1 putative MFS transporter [Syncephalis pseudoplumigaleata]